MSFRDETWLVGPNNAGKSTVIAALRAAAQMVSLAKRVGADYVADEAGTQVSSHSFLDGRFGLVDENLRHEFRDVETRMEITFSSGARLHAVWPRPSDDELNYFFVKSGDDVHLRTPSAVRNHVPTVGIVPTLSPVEHQETRLTDAHVRSNLSGRLASRHTRNQMLRLRDAAAPGHAHDLDAFLEWAAPWTPDFAVHEVVERMSADGVFLDVFCREADSPRERELFWAGDGMQVWVQLLMHLYRNRNCDVVVLDEPDLYLHADLQRRLVHVLESLSCQTVAASHSAEVLVEAPPTAVCWVAKERRHAVRAPSEKVSSDLTAALGSQFNLRLARALRARAVIFVEGDDMRILRNLAKTAGASRLAAEAGIVAIPLKGFTNWEHVEPFSWLVEDLLERAVRIQVLLDRDFRSDAQVSGVELRMRDVGVHAHVWRRKELESYLLSASAVARKSGAPVADVRSKLVELASARREEVFARTLSERLSTEISSTRHMTQVTEDTQRDFDADWATEETRLYRCNAKDVLSGLNRWLQADGYKAVSARSLSSALRPGEIPAEMLNVLDGLEVLVDPV